MSLRPLRPRLKAPPLSRLKPAQKKAEAFYLSPEWRALRSEVIAERGRRCEGCGKTLEADGSPVRLTLDHMVERKDGGQDWSKANLQLLCTRAGGNGKGGLGGCNGRKTAQARRERLGAAPMAATRADGRPGDPGGG